MDLIFKIKNDNLAELVLRRAGKAVTGEPLTIGPNFDKLLISSIDKLLVKNRIDRLSLKGLEILGKLREGSVSGMVVKAVRSALES